MSLEPEHALATLGEVLLTPTRIYARPILALRSALLAAGHDLRGIAHVTGGGLPGNVPRALPAGLGARLDPLRWRMPSVMRLMAALGGLADDEVRATFNGGLGMIVIVAPAAIEAATTALRAAGVESDVVGEVLPAGRLGGAGYAEGAIG
jgi:phosphoribosylformylglycinamidine cyclo-ligase